MLRAYEHHNASESAAATTILSASDSGTAVLQLNYLEELKEIPSSLKLLREQLESLNLDNNYSLKTLPPMLGDFPRLRSLDASYCSIVTISPKVCFLNRLTRLILSNNNISFLPTEFGQLKKLEELHVGNNKLQVLPGGLVFLPDLRELSVENNPLYTQEEIDGAAHVTLVPPQTSVDCANCCVRSKNYQVTISFHTLPSHRKVPLPFVFFVCSDECQEHLTNRLKVRHAELQTAE